jgi:hypothetical protein
VRASMSRRLLRVGDVLASLAILVSLLASQREPRLQTAPVYETAWPPPAGQLLRELATAQELFYVKHLRYAKSISELPPLRLPEGWQATVLMGSSRRYRLQLSAPTAWPSGVVCSLWGERTNRQIIEAFYIDCRPPEQSRLRPLRIGVHGHNDWQALQHRSMKLELERTL